MIPIGTRFGSRTVIAHAARDERTLQARVEVQCDCMRPGSRRVVYAHSLPKASSCKSCGGFIAARTRATTRAMMVAMLISPVVASWGAVGVKVSSPSVGTTENGAIMQNNLGKIFPEKVSLSW
ncbi:hypothetical protein NFI95_15705 [Acetobacteraceae bacterium KSS8]|uniref:Uncharacterized protein n=1 Tax=Endosaccharibacter trunci TaxID=2812733 RepID=A0ABT1WAJ0_9PROT|nr:hypothetical protein [Acetobacteraceae bacterium KSS8]